MTIRTNNFQERVEKILKHFGTISFQSGCESELGEYVEASVCADLVDVKYESAKGKDVEDALENLYNGLHKYVAGVASDMTDFLT